MASLITKLSQFANSPRGKQAIRELTERGQQLARDPKTRAKIDELRARFAGGGGSKGTGRRP
jgi:hypothetical protein